MIRRIKQTACIAAAAVLSVLLGITVPAAFDTKVEQSYNTAVQGQDALDGLDVKVKEQTVSSRTNVVSSKNVILKVTGIKDEQLSASIQVAADEDKGRSYYKDGYYYETVGEEKVRREMDRAAVWKLINSQIYLDMTSNYLKMLYMVDDEDGQSVYHFAANEETLGSYKEKLLDAYSEEHGAKIDSLQGSMKVDQDGHVTQRTISMVYTIGVDGEEEMFHKVVTADFSQSGEVTVAIPDLSAYSEEEPAKPAVTIVSMNRTAYVTDDVNVRAAGSLDAAIIGGYEKGSGISQTGLTSDGWAQIQYNGGTGYIWAEYVSAVKPVFVKDTSGTMYATTDVNVREGHGTEYPVLGVLRKGQSIAVTGIADNGWTRVNYQGRKGFISSNYLSRSEPVADTYVRNATISGTVTDASYGSLTIRTSGGSTMFFNTQYASMKIADTLETGDQVTVTYSGAGSPYTASAVVDSTTHYSASVPVQAYTVEGVVTDCSKKKVEMVCSDGMYRSFDISSASIEVQGGIHPGDYIMVTWYSQDGSETENIQAAAVA